MSHYVGNPEDRFCHVDVSPMRINPLYTNAIFHFAKHNKPRTLHFTY